MEDNIFDTASKQASQKKKTVDGKSQQEGVENPTKKTLSENSSSSEIDLMLKKMQDMKTDLENQLASVYRKGRESKINVSYLVESVSSLTKQQLEKIEEQKKLLVDKINVAIPTETCIKKNAKGKEKLTQERKGKMRGARNNWIPVK